MSCYIKQVEPRGKYPGSFHTNKTSRWREQTWDRNDGPFKGETLPCTLVTSRRRTWTSHPPLQHCRQFECLATPRSPAHFIQLSKYRTSSTSSSHLFIFPSQFLLLYFITFVLFISYFSLFSSPSSSSCPLLSFSAVFFSSHSFFFISSYIFPTLSYCHSLFLILDFLLLLLFHLRGGSVPIHLWPSVPFAIL